MFIMHFLFSFLFVLISFVAPVIFGAYGGNYSIRYNIGILYIALLNIGFILAFILYCKFVKEKLLNTFSIIILFCFIIFTIQTALKNNPLTVIAKIKTYYPPLVKATDTFSKMYNCKNGVGTIWSARQITCLSKQHVMINTVFDNLLPWQFGNLLD